MLTAMRGLVVLVGLATVVGCTTTPPPAIPTPGETPSSWAPLAVHTGTLDGADPAMDALAQGMFQVTDDCVFVDSGAERNLVVFRLSPADWTWDTSAREIVVPNGSGALRFGDGDEIWLGGGGRTGDYGPSLEEILGNYRWLSPPRRDCITPRVFFASGEIRRP
jgi:hypothetical protein